MAFLMAGHTRRLEIRWMVRAARAQLQNVVDVGSVQFHDLPTVATPPAIALIDVLAQWPPQIKRHPPVPRKPDV